MSLFEMDTTLPLLDIFPESWDDAIPAPRDFFMFRNLDHFKYVVSQITQKDNYNCDMTYETALDKLIRGESDFPEEEQMSIRNLVRKNLHKRGLITEEVYEAFKYSVNGTNVGVDVGKYANGDPDCVITPAREYVDYFYELYVSISYPYNVSNADVRRNTAKLLATIEELERQHIFIKITLILPIRNLAKGHDDSSPCANFFSSIPLFSHKEPKSVATMSAVVNDRLLRKFYFAILENFYKDRLYSHYGSAKQLDGSLNLGSKFDEIAFFEDIYKFVGA